MSDYKQKVAVIIANAISSKADSGYDDIIAIIFSYISIHDKIEITFGQLKKDKKLTVFCRETPSDPLIAAATKISAFNQDSLEWLNEKLGEYYKIMDRTDYYDSDKMGKLSVWCDDNGYEWDDIKEELNADPGDCEIIDFDETFPIPTGIEFDENGEHKDRNHYIFAVITNPDLYIYQQQSILTYNKLSKYKIKELENIDFNKYEKIILNHIGTPKIKLKQIVYSRENGHVWIICDNLSYHGKIITENEANGGQYNDDNPHQKYVSDKQPLIYYTFFVENGENIGFNVPFICINIPKNYSETFYAVNRYFKEVEKKTYLDIMFKCTGNGDLIWFGKEEYNKYYGINIKHAQKTKISDNIQETDVIQWKMYENLKDENNDFYDHPLVYNGIKLKELFKSKIFESDKDYLCFAAKSATNTLTIKIFEIFGECIFQYKTSKKADYSFKGFIFDFQRSIILLLFVEEKPGKHSTTYYYGYIHCIDIYGNDKIIKRLIYEERLEGAVVLDCIYKSIDNTKYEIWLWRCPRGSGVFLKCIEIDAKTLKLMKSSRGELVQYFDSHKNQTMVIDFNY